MRRDSGLLECHCVFWSLENSNDSVSDSDIPMVSPYSLIQ